MVVFCVILWCYATGTSCTSIWKAPWVYPVIRKIFITPWNLVVPKPIPQDQMLLQLQLWWYFVLFCDVMQQALPACENLPGLSLVHRNKNGSLVSFRWKSVQTKYLNWAMIITSKSKRIGRRNKNGSLGSFRWKSVRTKYLNLAMIITSKSKRMGRRK